MSEELEEPAKNYSTTVAAPISEGPMLPTVVGVDEVIGEHDDDVGDELVLDEDKGGGRAPWCYGLKG